MADIPHQFQSANKLPHMQWVIPNALENRDIMNTAWYLPTPLTPFPSSRPELDDPEDEDGMKTSRTYIESLIDELVAKGIPEKRIVLGGFSQGCAMTLLTGLTSKKYAGKLGGLVGLSGYLPLAEKIPTMREEEGLENTLLDDDVPIFLARGMRDMLVPKRFLRMCYEMMFAYGKKQEQVTIKEYEGMGHVLSGSVLRDMCEFLEKVVPPLNGASE